MGGLRQGRGRLLFGLVPAALLLVGCSGAIPQGKTDALLTINVEMTADGFQPSSIQITKGERVQLIIRNRDTTEHHFKVQGLIPKELLWIAAPGTTREEGVSDQEHEEHHPTSGLTAWRGTSPAGIKPTGYEVHAFAQGRAADRVIFTATNSGTFAIRCVLHPEMTGKLTVK